MRIHIDNETTSLKSVILGIANQNGPTPKPEECYDPKSKQHVLAGTYPLEADMLKELDAFLKVLNKYNVKVYRPEIITDVNQIFTRDIAFVIDNLFFKSNILPNRFDELQAVDYIIKQIDPKQVITLPADVHVEGGDVMPYNDYLFIGTYTAPDYPQQITARTNAAAVAFLTKQFPNKKVKAFELRKSTEAKNNALHLDCCFQPVGKDKAIIHKNGFLNEADYHFLINLFGEDNVFEITKDEMYNMNSNVFSISEKVVVSEQNFTRLNTWLLAQGFLVEEIPYAEIAKQEGLLRCSTLPLLRG
ncbi:MAG: amidinotransferase [Flavobacteriales bacterium]|jgi:N-dimethylarginine dimethylaminohydrolase|nr:amidinotransferase [Flavobacteriales bacterium]